MRADLCPCAQHAKIGGPWLIPGPQLDNDLIDIAFALTDLAFERQGLGTQLGAARLITFNCELFPCAFRSSAPGSYLRQRIGERLQRYLSRDPRCVQDYE